MEQIQLITKAIITRGDSVLILKRSSDQRINPDKWSYPGGKVRVGESIEEACIREIMEETSLKIRIDRLLRIRTFKSIIDDSLMVAFDFECSLMQKPDVVLNHEHSRHRWVKKDAFVLHKRPDEKTLYI